MVGENMKKRMIRRHPVFEEAQMSVITKNKKK